MTAKKQAAARRVAEIEARIGYAFRDADRLQKALTHASARSAGGADYERLEFLGDRVLGLVVADMLFSALPGATEGELALRLNALVNGRTCAQVADAIGLGEFIRTDSGIRAMRGPKGASVKADVMEALIAAIYLDGGLAAAGPFVRRWWEPLSRVDAVAWRDAKTELQEWAHQAAGAQPVYAVESREGPDHDPLFTVTVTVGALAPATGRGRAKREAEQAAATVLLVREGVRPAEGEAE